jgi:hypothetical protein
MAAQRKLMLAGRESSGRGQEEVACLRWCWSSSVRQGWMGRRQISHLGKCRRVGSRTPYRDQRLGTTAPISAAAPRIAEVKTGHNELKHRVLPLCLSDNTGGSSFRQHGSSRPRRHPQGLRHRSRSLHSPGRSRQAWIVPFSRAREWNDAY